MRPDQHKKKKNAEYKKKHGIPKDKPKRHNKKGLTSVHGSDETVETPKSGEPKEPTEELPGTHDSDDDDQQRFFSRRKLESNWDRYREGEFEEFDSNSASAVSSSPTGADYRSLLDKATSASSHFQFKSEKEWENLNDTETSNKAGPSLMSLNCHALAQSLRNIPLEKRLEIDKKYFEDECHGSKINSDEGGKPILNYYSNQETTKIGSEKQITKVSPKIEKEKNHTLYNSKSSNKQNTKPTSTDVENKSKKIKENVNTNEPSINSVGEDDLGFLLGFENKELQSVRNQTGDQASPATKIDVTKTTPQNVDDTKEDLEDWLDSILDN